MKRVKLEPIWEIKMSGKYEAYSKLLESLKERYGDRNNLNKLSLKNVTKTYNNIGEDGIKRYEGVLDDNANISPLELAMIVENGFSFMGGYAEIKHDGSFIVEVEVVTK